MLPLNIKTDYSLLESMIKIDDLIDYAKNNNLKYLTITDNNMYGAIEFYQKCIKNDIKPIIGINIFYKEKQIVLYAKNYKGYQSLIKVLEGDFSNSDDLICIIPFRNKDLYDELKDIYPDIFISYKNNDEKENISVRKIYMNEILCLKKEDEKFLKYLNAIKEGKTYKEINYTKENVSLEENLTNDKYIINNCNLTIPFHQDYLPRYASNSYEILKKECLKGLKNKFGSSINRKYQIRLKKELNIINSMHFCDYFLIVEDYVKYAKENDILVGPGRGSAAGSLVSYLLDITEVDPLKYDLLFERFLNPDRVTMPDIDVDFEDEKREEVIDYCVKKYGEKNVTNIITFGTMKSRQAIRDAGRVLNVSSDLIDRLAKRIDSKLSLKENYDRVKDLLNNNILRSVYLLALKFDGLKRHTSIHASGVIISGKEIDTLVPLEKGFNRYIASYENIYLEELGLLKMDFLGIKNLTFIKKILNEVNLKFSSIPLNDPKTIYLFNKADTSGIFQFDSDGMINFLKKLKVKNFDDIVVALALYRPGPMQNIDSYIRRREGREKIDYIDSSIENILKPTYGIIIYQEQIMQIAVTMASFTMAEADNLRRAMSKKKVDILLKEKDRFINNSIKNGHSKEASEKVYNLILRFANYGFNKSHSVSYGLISYRMGYLKANYPYVFMKYLLNDAIGTINLKKYILECKKDNIKIISPSINKSMDKFIIDKYLIFPLSGIKGITNGIIKIIIDNRPYNNIFDFFRKCSDKLIDKKVITNLVYAGCFDEFNISRKTIINSIDVLLNYGMLSSLSDTTPYPELEQIKDYSSDEKMKQELDVIGFYLTMHPVTKLRIKYNKLLTINDLPKYFDKVIDIIIYVSRINKIKTKNNEDMAFITGSDETSKIDLVLFPKTYNLYSYIKEGDVLLIRGKVEKRFDKYQISVSRIKNLNDM